VGGVALAIHGAPRATQDIDILLRREDIEQLADGPLETVWADLADIKRLEEAGRG
jgi:hypothetical protein